MRHTLVGLLLLTVSSGACALDDSPTLSDARTGGVSLVSSPSLVAAGSYAGPLIECRFAIRSGLPSTGCASVLQPGATPRATVFPQQCQIVCVQALSPTYDPKSGLWVVQFRLTDQSYQPLGTLDGRTPSSWKTSIVMVDVPRATIGAGTIEVRSPTARISAHPSLPRSMPYLTYPGIHPQGQPSDFHSFGLVIPGGIREFVLRVVVVADLMPLVKLTEAMPGVRTGTTVSTGAYLELENVGSAPIGGTTLVVVDSVTERKTVVLANMPITDDWQPRERRVVASTDLRPVLVAPVYGVFPTKHVFDDAVSHRIRVMTGGRYGRVADDLWINARTIALGGTAFERAYSDMGGSSTKLYDPAWKSATERVPTRCAGAAGCPILKGTPGKSPI